MKPSIIALIPARSGSTRVPDKNIRVLNGYPLISYTIKAAIKSGIFKDVIVSTDSIKYAEIAKSYGAKVPFLRPQEISGDTSADIEWVKYTLEKYNHEKGSIDCFSILRATSPFRTSATIKRAWKEFLNEKEVDSLRAVQKCSVHPAKMWIIKNNRMNPVIEGEYNGQPLHSNQYQVLPEIYEQNASLEIAWSKVVWEYGNISGKKIVPFITKGYEGFDINKEIDWLIAEEIIKTVNY